MKHTLLAVLAALLYAATLNAQNREADLLALEELYCITNGLFWTNTWDLNTLGTPSPMEEWHGVTTELIGGEFRVTRLDLNNNNLSGILPDLNLTELRYLDLSENHLTDAIPEFTYLNNLEELYLNDNHFTDALPDSGLNSLRIMNLEYNYLTVIPEFTGLTALEELNLSDNHITAIPDAINLASLLKLSIEDNHLFGTIPNITGLPVLEELNLSNRDYYYSPGNNHLSGTLPDFDNLTNLRILRINNNYLSGEVADLMTDNLEELHLKGNRLTSVFDFNHLSALETLNLDYNSLSTVPNFEGLPSLLNLHLSHNMISDVPLFSDLDNLQRLYLNDNCLTGAVPEFQIPTLTLLHLQNNYFTEVTNGMVLPDLCELDLSNSNLTGPIPSFSGLNNVKTLNLSWNCLEGSIPSFTAINPEIINLSHNCLTGDVPDCAGLTSLRELDLSHNQLDDNSIPDFSLTVLAPLAVGECPSSNLQIIRLNNNNLSGPIPNFEELFNLQTLDLSYNQFTGQVPSFEVILPDYDANNSVCNFNTVSGGLQELRLNDNKLDGDIPLEIGDLAELRSLNLSNNDLTGTIPSGIGNLKRLRWLNLGYNDLEGGIPNFSGTVPNFTPDNICPSSNLIEIRLDSNKLSGTIPNFNYAIYYLQILDLGYNDLIGPIPSFEGTISPNYNIAANCDDNVSLSNLQILRLDNNNLGGTVLDEYFDSMFSLNILDLSHNNFIGNAPTMSGTVPPPITPPFPSSNIRELYLNDNSFSGQIPDFAGLYNLRRLHLDDNQFTGVFPPAFADLDNWIYPYVTLYGNSGLVGCYDASLYLLCNNYIDSDSISNGTNFDATWDVFCMYYDDAAIDGEDVCDCAYRDRKELMRLYDALDETTWSNSTNWGTSAPLVDWYGITVVGGCVTEINLGSNNLTGIIPNNLFLLDLEYLNLSGNEGITGGIPQWIAELESLITIDLSDCSLSICYADYLEPRCSGNVFSNNSISAGNNFPFSWSSFCGGEPCPVSQPECSDDRAELIAFYEATNGGDWAITWDIDALSMLSWEGVELTPDGCVARIALPGNGLEGTLPNMNLPELISLDLSKNDLIGVLPTFENMPKLEGINLSQNHFTGIIHNFNLPELTYLNLSSNALTTLPNMGIPNFSGIDKLTELYLENNHLTGTIPNFDNLPDLWRLYLDYNDLTGPIPLFNNLTNLKDLELNDNNLNNNIPNFNLPLLNDLQLQNNNLEGDIPNFTYLSLLSNLNLSNNNLTGGIPDFTNLPELDNLYLYRNNLIGAIPDFTNLPELDYLSLYHNNLIGAIPDFTNLTNLKDVRLNDNNLTGGIPEAFVGTEITKLVIRNNLLSGCYNESLMALCTQLGDNSKNSNISDGNGFIVPWEDFCDDMDFSCDDFNLSVEPTPTHLDTCDDNDGEIFLQVNYGSPPYEFYWSDPALTTHDLNNLPAGEYTVTVIDCKNDTVIETVVLEMPPLPEINNVIDTSATCQANNGSLEIIAGDGTSDYEYSLDGENWQLNDPNFPGLEGGSYTVYVRDDLGCIGQEFVEIGDTPLAIVNTTDVTDAKCEAADGSITLTPVSGTPEYWYSFHRDSFFQSSPTFDLLEGDTLYRAYLRDAENCLDSIDIYVGDTPRVDFNATPTQPSCGKENGIIEIDVMSGTHPYTYDLNGGINQISSAGGLGNDSFIDFDDLAGGDYSVTITDAEGCQEETLIELDVSNPLTINVDTINEPCIGDDNCGEIRINLSGWNNPYVDNLEMGDDSIFCVPVDTTFFIITDNDNCLRDSFVYFEPFEYQENIIPESAELRIGDMEYFQIINAGKADWYSEDDPDLDNLDFEDDELRLNVTFTAPPYTDNNNGCEQNISYKIVAYNEAGNCKDTLILPIRVLNEINIPPGITPNADGINDVLEIPLFDSYDNIKFVIFNRWGDRVYEFVQKDVGNYQGNEWDGTYHKDGLSTGRKLPDGDYFYTLQFGNCPKIQRGTIFIR